LGSNRGSFDDVTWTAILCPLLKMAADQRSTPTERLPAFRKASFSKPSR
jgi:hypothetical protein